MWGRESKEGFSKKKCYFKFVPCYFSLKICGARPPKGRPSFAAVVIGSGSGWPGGNGNVGVAGPEKHVPQNVRYELAIHIFFFEPLFILIALLNVTILLDSTFPLDFKIDKLGSIDF